jgi:hypothetical protein
MVLNQICVAKGYDPLYSSSPLASLDGFSRSHGLYVMQLVVAATNQEKCQQNKNAKNRQTGTILMNSHWMVLFQNGVRQLRSPAKMAATVQLRCY